ncbi:MAG: 3-hydroxybutyryl-CoA dehydrogenase [Frankiales bacterium]|nr:3-hydroxybutyryl-CoA dehydrogenase [Frankiales bacterium]
MTFTEAAVVGLGTMGAGIAEVLTRTGLQVTAVEVNTDLLEAGRGRVATSLQRAQDRGRLSAEDRALIDERLRFTADRADLSSVDLVVEAVPERLDVKAALFAELESVCKPEAVFATNTSSLSVTAIAAATSRPNRVVGMHFFNPAPVMQVVEIVATVLADDAVVNGVRELADRCGKTPVVVADRAGFIANALLLPYLNDAARHVETGRGTVESVDAAMRERAGFPMGPLALMDLIGLDVCLPILDVLWDEFRDPRYAATPLLRRLVVAGRLGRKTGRGWYRYDSGEPVGDVPAPVRVGKPDADALLSAHLADAVRMAGDGYATEDDIDTAMRLGCGYPRGPFAMLAE